MFACLHVHMGAHGYLWLCMTVWADRGHGTSLGIILPVSLPFPSAEARLSLQWPGIYSLYPPSIGITSASPFSVDSGIELTYASMLASEERLELLTGSFWKL